MTEATSSDNDFTTITTTFQPSLTSSNDQQREPIQLLRPAGDCYEARELLEYPRLTPEDVDAFVRHGTLPTPSSSSWRTKYDTLLQAYHTRRNEIRDLVTKLDTGASRIDEHGRLIPIATPQQNRNMVPPPPVAPPMVAGPMVAAAAMAPQQRPLNPPLPPLPHRNHLHNNNNNNNNMLNGMGDNEEAERRRFEQEEQEAADAIARAVMRYRDAGVPEDEFVLIRVSSSQNNFHHQLAGGGGGGVNHPNVRLTFRRICFAVLAVSTAFGCIMLQTLPLFRRNKEVNPIFDKLMYKLFHVRHFEMQARFCPGLHRENTLTRLDWLWRSLGQSSKVDCSDGVLHIPAQHVLREKSVREVLTNSNNKIWLPFAQGVNLSWFFPCHPPPSSSSCFSSPTWSVCEASPVCHASLLGEGYAAPPVDETKNACFRGVHDGIVSSVEVDEALRFGAQLIQQGGDHFDIYHDHNLLQILIKRLPDLMERLQNLLYGTYRIDRWAQRMVPVAFRVSGAAPMDGTDVRYGMEPLFRILNLTKYTRWIKKCKRRNELARYAVPWPFSSLQPVRDTCHLMADLDAHEDFHILTSVFLSTGAGREYRGGVSLYVDHPKKQRSIKLPSHYRNLVRRGLTIDGSRGRVVISTGGWENRRCRLPTRAGIRAELQIWWKCS